MGNRVVPPRGERRRESPLGRVAAPAVGIAIATLVLVSSSRERASRGLPPSDEYVVWSGLVLALLGAAAVSWRMGVRARRRVSTVRSVAWRAPAIHVGALLLVLLLLLVWVALNRGAPGEGWRGLALTLAAVAGAAPIAWSMFGIRLAAKAASGQVDLGEELAAHLELREITLDLLRPLGALVTLSTLALGTVRLADVATGVGPDSDITVLVFGVAGAAVVGGVYNVPRSALRREARQLRDRLAPIDGTSPDAINAALRRRKDLEGDLGLTTTLVAELNAATWVSGPLLAAVSALLLTTR